MELEEAIEKLNYLKTIRDLKDYVKDNNCMLADAIDVVLKELEKKDKMIEIMLDFLECLQLGKGIEGYEIMAKENWKQYFEKKAEEGE